MSLIGGNEGATWATGIGSVPVGESAAAARKQVAATRDPDLCDHGAHPADGGCAQCVGKDATPKHDEGREAAWEKFISDPRNEGATSAETEQRFCFNAGYSAALATQPAARRVTDAQAQRFAEIARDGTVSDFQQEFAAIRSWFAAQPAEGVSGGSWDEDGDEEPCSFCLCRGCNGECGGDQL